MNTVQLLCVVAAVVGAAGSVRAQLPPAPPTGPPVPPSSRDADWLEPFNRADLLCVPQTTNVSLAHWEVLY